MRVGGIEAAVIDQFPADDLIEAVFRTGLQLIGPSWTELLSAEQARNVARLVERA